MPAKTNSTSYNCFTKSNWIIPWLIPPVLKAVGPLRAPGLDLSVRESHAGPSTTAPWWDPIRSRALEHPALLQGEDTAQAASCATLLNLGQTLLPRTFLKQNQERNPHPLFDTPWKPWWETKDQTRSEGEHEEALNCWLEAGYGRQ